MSDDDSILTEMDFCGDAAPTSMDPYRNNILGSNQQSILNNLRIDRCREDIIYLNKHKEVEAIATLLLKDILDIMPKNPYDYAARFIMEHNTRDRVANFIVSKNMSLAKHLLDEINEDVADQSESIMED